MAMLIFTLKNISIANKHLAGIIINLIFTILSSLGNRAQ